ncbi:MAG: twin-arginine translocase TatA/TatE family subunit [Planctomycetales bacterium]|nr:twin-arginine translocase TatA/TatE family subunit [Planctomycetales bacterium]
MFGLGHWELLIVLGIFMLLFGGARIPGIARSLGKSITEFKKGVKGIEDEGEDESKKTEDKPA